MVIPRTSRALCAIVAPAIVLGWSTAARAGVAPDAPYVPGQVVVRFDGRTTSGVRAADVGGLNARVSQRLPVPGAELLGLAPGQSVRSAVSRLEGTPGVRWAEPNYVMSADQVPPGSGFSQLWGFQNLGQVVLGSAGTAGVDIGAPSAWDVTTGSSSVLVGVVDTGTQADHPDLAANVRGGLARDFVSSPLSNNPIGEATVDENGHGTHVAGTIGAVGENGVVGVNWRVGLVPIRALGATGFGTSVQVAEAFAYAGQRGLPVANASLSAPRVFISQVLEDAIAESPQTLFVVAAGNNSQNDDDPAQAAYPCAFPEANILCVAAIDSTGVLGRFSNYGAHTVGLAAPGVNVYSTVATPEIEFDDSFTQPLAGRWTTGGENDNWGIYNDPTLGQPVLASSQDGSAYLPNTDSYAKLTAPIDLAGKSGCTLSVSSQLDSAGSEAALTFERSTDGVSWLPIVTQTPTTGFSRNPDLQADGQPSVWLRVRFTTAAAVTPHTGAEVSNLHVNCVQAGADNYGYKTGTSMATPMVAGAAALLLARNPTLSTAQLRSALLTTARPMPSLQGKTISGGMLDLPAALAAVAPASSPGPSPPASAAPTPAVYPPDRPPASPPSVAVTAAPSSFFAIRGGRSRRPGEITLGIDVPGPGALDVLGTHSAPGSAALGRLWPGGKRIEWGRLHASVSRRGRVRITLRPNRLGKRLLRRARRLGRGLRVRVWITYLPTGGHPRSRSLTVRVVPSRRKRR